MAKQPPSYSKWITFTISDEWANHTVEEVLKGPLLLSGRMLNRLTRGKGILLNGRAPYLKKKVKTGDQLKVAVRPQEKSELAPEPVPFELIYEDLDLMLVNKPAGVAVHPVRPTDRGTLVHGILYHLQAHGGGGVVRPVHRLDRDTSGLILVAKNAYMHQLLDRQLREKSLKRGYLALIGATLPQVSGTISAPIGRDPQHPTRRRVTERGEPALTHYQVLNQSDRGALVQVQLETGRTHQIRVHFAHLGAPLIGDRLYGGPGLFMKRQALHSAELAFTHPLTGEMMRFTSPLPADMETARQQMGL
ncbi:RluA family pseudouridine synthase [Laceyella putida]|uniref:Pseudouridine synthase n=1 Tax=Laceyella putida TaxID=110101 RepID=A0ABW2RQF9_9BACL